LHSRREVVCHRNDFLANETIASAIESNGHQPATQSSFGVCNSKFTRLYCISKIITQKHPLADIDRQTITQCAIVLIFTHTHSLYFVIIQFKNINKRAKNIKYNLYVVSKDFIHDLNLNTRGVDKATDVLSYPNTEIKVGEVIDFDRFKLDIDPMDNSLLIGEIFICNEVAKAQAKKYNHSYRREFCFLFLHGVLHCLGYDHIEKEDEKLKYKLLLLDVL
jgi:probable rRNA maturation factor